MKIEGGISISRQSSNQGPDYISIRLRDNDAAAEFAQVRLTLEQFAQAVTGLTIGDCEIEVNGLDRVGRRMETAIHTFPMPRQKPCDKEVAAAGAKETCPEGWTPDTYFGSQSSFFRQDGVPWARCTIRRWVEKDGVE